MIILIWLLLFIFIITLVVGISLINEQTYRDETEDYIKIPKKEGVAIKYE